MVANAQLVLEGDRMQERGWGTEQEASDRRKTPTGPDWTPGHVEVGAL